MAWMGSWVECALCQFYHQEKLRGKYRALEPYGNAVHHHTLFCCWSWWTTPVLVCLVLLFRNTQNWAICKKGNLFLTVLEAEKSKIKAPAGLFSGKGWCSLLPIWHLPEGINISLHGRRRKAKGLPWSNSFIRTSNVTHQRGTLMASSPFKDSTY
jgi:hypothetical protein